MPFVIAGVSEGSVNTSLESKDLVLFPLMVKKSKYFDEAKF
jgi:regulator of sigma E protease